MFAKKMMGKTRLALGMGLLLCAATSGASPPQGGEYVPGVTSVAGDIDRSQLPGPGPAPRIALPVPERMTLSNGTKVLVVERHTLPVVAMLMVWPVGGLDDPSDRPGMAALCADMLDEGAGDKGALDLAEAFARLGARIATRSDLAATIVSSLTLARNFDETFKLFADVVKRPQMSPKELDRVKNDTATALKQRLDVPANLAQDVFEKTLYGASHRRGSPAAGTAEAVQLLDALDMKWWHRERLRPDDATLIVVGDITAAALKPKLEAELASWKAPPKRKDPIVQPAAAAAERRIVVVDQPGKSQTVLAIGQTGVPRNHPDFFPLQVMNAILGGQFNSRINMNLREKRGYAYGAYSNFAFDRDGGPFAVRASVKGATTKASVDEVLKEIAKLRQSGVEADELAQAKDLMVRSLARRFETVLQVATELAVIEIFKLPDDYLATYADKVKAVSAADVQRVANQYLEPGKMTIVLAGDRKEVDKVGELNLGSITYAEVPVSKAAPAGPKGGKAKEPKAKEPGKAPAAPAPPK